MYWSLTPQNLTMWPCLEIGLLQMYLVKMRSSWSRVALHPVKLVPWLKGGNLDRNRHVQRRDDVNTQKKNTSKLRCHKSRSIRATRGWKRQGKILLLQISEGAWPCQQIDFRLPASKIVERFHCSKPPSLWHSVMAALGNLTQMLLIFSFLIPATVHFIPLCCSVFGCEKDSIRPGSSLWECPCDEGGVFREQEVFIPVRNVTEPREEERSKKR